MSIALFHCFDSTHLSKCILYTDSKRRAAFHTLYLGSNITETSWSFLENLSDKIRIFSDIIHKNIVWLPIYCFHHHFAPLKNLFMIFSLFIMGFIYFQLINKLRSCSALIPQNYLVIRTSNHLYFCSALEFKTVWVVVQNLTNWVLLSESIIIVNI